MIVGVLGGGQLGRMLALAGYPLGMRFRFFDTAADAVAGHVAPLAVGRFDDLAALDRFADGLDVVTYEFENVPVEAARHLAQRVPVWPPPEALEASQDRLAEKTLFSRLGVPTTRFAAVDAAADLPRALDAVGSPAVLKTRRLGYDGKGQAVVRTLPEAEAALARFAGAPAIAEEFVRFDREVSMIAARGRGETAFYPLVENEHREGILRVSRAPAAGGGAESIARRHASAIMDAVGYRGVLTVEFFDRGGTLLANEIAPRVHNSGHWTIEGAACSQFENHLRAVAGLPLGNSAALAHAGMVNILGTMPDAARLLAMPCHVHLYGKEPRPGRKLGHATVIRESAATRDAAAEQVRAFLES
ncbi:MAG: 5-(carboxyamino)imidazole ribonucleotide synthase [Phycisphaerae bacterium]|nr:5-(carboxyamino)imidazole ribonucleotide synthase [Phycisphaerae bacterium]